MGLAEKQHFRPYFAAVEQILRGTPVPELDKIRTACNADFHMSNPDYGKISALMPEAVVISFLSAAENKILMGTRPEDAYSGMNDVALSEMRERGRRILERAVKYYS